MKRRQDMVLGALFALLGLAAAWRAGSYTGATGGYPMVLGLCLATCGTVVFGRGAIASTDGTRQLFDDPKALLIVAIATTLYIALIVPLGFFTTSALLMLGLPVALGLRRPIFIVVTGALFLGMVWAIFTLLLEKPLPKELILSFWGGG